MGKEFDPRIRQEEAGVFTTDDEVIWDGEAEVLGVPPLTKVPDRAPDQDEDDSELDQELSPEVEAEIMAILGIEEEDDLDAIADAFADIQRRYAELRADARHDDIAAHWDENEHPRDKSGRFSKSGGGGALGKGLRARARQYAHEDYQILRKHLEHAHPAEQKKLTDHIKSVAKSLPDLLKSHLREEKANAVQAVGALKSLAGGSRPSPEQMKGLRAFGTRILMVSASAALGDATGSIGHLASALGHEVVQHVIVEHALKLFAGAGMLATTKVQEARADAAGDEDMALLQRFVEAIGQAIEDLEDVLGEGEARKDAAEFREEDHPRDEDGKFTEGGGSSRSSMAETKVEKGQRVTSTGKPLPKHIASLRIPPAWSDVRINENPGADLLVTGKDTKGRPTAIYSAAHSARQAALKYARVKELADEFDAIRSQNAEARKDPEKRDLADCLGLIMATGIRPGSHEDTGAEVQAYGATTLEGRHVRVRAGGKVVLEFVGKKGVALAIPIEDGKVARELLKRKDKAGPKGRIFGDISRQQLLKYAHSMDGGGFKTKDFRTHLGTATAARLVTSREAPTDAKTYKRAVLDVAKAVSSKLGNTPAIALQSYINPVVFAPWRTAAGV